MLKPERANLGWPQVMGIPQFVQLTLTLFDDIVDDWNLTIPRTVPMNVYLIFEVVSDDMAIGLARELPGDSTRALRTRALRQFNEVMVKRLTGQENDTSAALEGARSLVANVSGFGQSLNSNKRWEAVATYLAENPTCTPEELEFAVWPSLVANIESCFEVLDSMQGTQ